VFSLLVSIPSDSVSSDKVCDKVSKEKTKWDQPSQTQAPTSTPLALKKGVQDPALPANC